MTSLKRSKKRENPDPLGLSVSKRPSDERGSGQSDRIGNDILEAVAIFLALVGMIGAGIALYYLSQQV